MSGNIKYFICYDVQLSKKTRRTGKQEISTDPYDKKFALNVAEKLNAIWGDGTHWIEDETGERIEE